MDQTGYPRALRRIQGALIDSVIVPAAAIGAIVALTYAGVTDGHVKAAIAVGLIVLLEPVAVAATGGTIGHHLVGLRVRRVDEDRRLPLWAALLRFIVKAPLGLPSFLVILMTRRRQALHDLVAFSLMVHRNAAGLPDHELIPELTAETERRVYTNLWQRLGVVLAYLTLWFLLYVAALSMLTTPDCIERGICDDTELLVMATGPLVFLPVAVALVILGWMGRLYGARKRRVVLQKRIPGSL